MEDNSRDLTDWEDRIVGDNRFNSYSYNVTFPTNNDIDILGRRGTIGENQNTSNSIDIFRFDAETSDRIFQLSRSQENLDQTGYGSLPKNYKNLLKYNNPQVQKISHCDQDSITFYEENLKNSSKFHEKSIEIKDFSILDQNLLLENNITTNQLDNYTDEQKNLVNLTNDLFNLDIRPAYPTNIIAQVSSSQNNFSEASNNTISSLKNLENPQTLNQESRFHTLHQEINFQNPKNCFFEALNPSEIVSSFTTTMNETNNKGVALETHLDEDDVYTLNAANVTSNGVMNSHSIPALTIDSKIENTANKNSFTPGRDCYENLNVEMYGHQEQFFQHRSSCPKDLSPGTDCSSSVSESRSKEKYVIPETLQNVIQGIIKSTNSDVIDEHRNSVDNKEIKNQNLFEEKVLQNERGIIGDSIDSHDNIVHTSAHDTVNSKKYPLRVIPGEEPLSSKAAISKLTDMIEKVSLNGNSGHLHGSGVATAGTGAYNHFSNNLIYANGYVDASDNNVLVDVDYYHEGRRTDNNGLNSRELEEEGDTTGTESAADEMDKVTEQTTISAAKISTNLQVNGSSYKHCQLNEKKTASALTGPPSPAKTDHNKSGCNDAKMANNRHPVTNSSALHKSGVPIHHSKTPVNTLKLTPLSGKKTDYSHVQSKCGSLSFIKTTTASIPHSAAISEHNSVGEKMVGRRTQTSAIIHSNRATGVSNRSNGHQVLNKSLGSTPIGTGKNVMSSPYKKPEYLKNIQSKVCSLPIGYAVSCPLSYSVHEGARISANLKSPRNLQYHQIDGKKGNTNNDHFINISHVHQPQHHKLDLKNVKSKIGSLENTTYTSSGGKIKIQTYKLEFKEKATPKVQSKLLKSPHSDGGGEENEVNHPLSNHNRNGITN